MAPGHKTGGRTKNTPNSSGQSRPLAPAPAASQHFGEIEARSADLSKVDKTRAEWGVDEEVAHPHPLQITARLFPIGSRVDYRSKGNQG
jgi:hypothetical protein